MYYRIHTDAQIISSYFMSWISLAKSYFLSYLRIYWTALRELSDLCNFLLIYLYVLSYVLWGVNKIVIGTERLSLYAITVYRYKWQENVSVAANDKTWWFVLVMMIWYYPERSPKCSFRVNWAEIKIFLTQINK